MIRHKGFTLIELLITLAIIGIMAVMGGNAYQQYAAKTNLRAAAGDISSDFANYKTRARSEGRVYTIAFNTVPTNNYSISAPASGNFNAFNLVRTPAAEITGVDFTGCSTVRIITRGLIEHCAVTPSAQNSDGTVSLRNERGSTAVITISATVKTYVNFQ